MYVAILAGAAGALLTSGGLAMAGAALAATDEAWGHMRTLALAGTVLLSAGFGLYIIAERLDGLPVDVVEPSGDS